MTYIVIPVEGGGPSSISIKDLVPIEDGSFPGTGEVGERVYSSTSILSSTNVGASGDWGFAESITLDAGFWEIGGIAELSENDAVLTDAVGVGISDSATGLTLAYGDSVTKPIFLNGAPFQLESPKIRVSIAAPLTGTYYLNTKFNYTSGNPEHAGIIWAVRVG